MPIIREPTTEDHQIWKQRRSGQSAEFTFDKGRIIGSAAFRRLQGKTQIHPVGEHDFFRTRLTHTLEVAQTATRIVDHFTKINREYLEWLPSHALIEAICYVHDIGHPAFGHNGERALHYFMHDHGGFEGNGQTLRILTKLGEFSAQNGFDLTRRTLLGTLKYPVLYKLLKQKNSNLTYSERNMQGIAPLDIDPWTPPKCLLDTEEDVLDWLLEPFTEVCASASDGLMDKDRFVMCFINHNGEHKPQHKTLDASIMELADDIAYGVSDLEDALAMGLITPQEVSESLKETICTCLKMSEDRFDQLLDENSRSKGFKQFSSLITYSLIRLTDVKVDGSFSNPLFSLRAGFKPEALQCIEELKKFVYNRVISSPAVQTIEYKGQRIIIEIFNALAAKPDKLLPLSVSHKIKADTQNDKYRVICDYISSMTDSEACKLHARLFTPDQGSIFIPMA